MVCDPCKNKNPNVLSACNCKNLVKVGCAYFHRSSRGLTRIFLPQYEICDDLFIPGNLTTGPQPNPYERILKLEDKNNGLNTEESCCKCIREAPCTRSDEENDIWKHNRCSPSAGSVERSRFGFLLTEEQNPSKCNCCGEYFQRLNF